MGADVSVTLLSLSFLCSHKSPIVLRLCLLLCGLFRLTIDDKSTLAVRDRGKTREVFRPWWHKHGRSQTWLPLIVRFCESFVLLGDRGIIVFSIFSPLGLRFVTPYIVVSLWPYLCQLHIGQKKSPQFLSVLLAEILCEIDMHEYCKVCPLSHDKNTISLCLSCISA